MIWKQTLCNQAFHIFCSNFEGFGISAREKSDSFCDPHRIILPRFDTNGACAIEGKLFSSSKSSISSWSRERGSWELGAPIRSLTKSSHTTIARVLQTAPQRRRLTFTGLGARVLPFVTIWRICKHSALEAFNSSILIPSAGLWEGRRSIKVKGASCLVALNATPVEIALSRFLACAFIYIDIHTDVKTTTSSSTTIYSPSNRSASTSPYASTTCLAHNHPLTSISWVFTTAKLFTNAAINTSSPPTLH